MKAASIRRCSPTSPEHDPEKCEAVFLATSATRLRGDHAQTKDNAMSVDVLTFGCRLNAFESEVIRHEAESAGLSDTIVINSCAVTNEAVAQARQSIRRLKRA